MKRAADREERADGVGERSSLPAARLRDEVVAYDDLEPALLGRVEELIDFVTVD